MRLDRTDFEILRVLQNDARTPNKVLAAAVGLAGSTVHERVKRLEAAGVIRGATVTLDPAAFGVGLEAILMVTLAKHDRALVDRFMTEVAQVNEVRALFLISGRYDVVAHVVVRDVAHLRDLALDAFTSREGVEQIETAVVFEKRESRALAPLLAPE
ncbi:Lrp/AsnC family transcriptional regulator [Salinarimonas rosea]|uniref:Lrp/AsnC family transcriptional regulator n=1 Tax=Salinarimonas rosea TaxID=552063 RepID=UPI000429463C|nr:Lrp/AsnC family transcriptional regulator [Salinarimonas rosea]